ncbi:phosphate acyltransferase [Steroidobacter denitrificans]|uniref:Phosphate acyltransferase n=1 Tax=Steroidobacter denitrificans TaxID=465721 RepID=A0A127FA29_STEDE|nr:phosphate acyltransferase [Steroidobacter denitrificans]
MGGDHGPSVTVPAVLDALRRHADLHIVLVGLSEPTRAALGRSSASFGSRLLLREVTQVVSMDERPQDALRKKKDSSMRVALDLVKSGEADACVSAGNTGALMATGRFVLKTIDGIDRPAIISRIRARHGYTHMLDLGANAQCSAQHLFQFAVMGAVVAGDMAGIAQPRIGILNIGEEETKGDGVVQEAARLLSASQLNYVGFVEGNDIFSGEADVVVTDGFTGNVALKAIEGLANMLVGAIKEQYTANPLRYLGAIASWPALRSLRREFDPRTYNGASMVGLNGVVVKSHGSADVLSFGNAIGVGLAEAQKGVPTRIGQMLREQLAHVSEHISPLLPASEPHTTEVTHAAGGSC